MEKGEFWVPSSDARSDGALSSSDDGYRLDVERFIVEPLEITVRRNEHGSRISWSGDPAHHVHDFGPHVVHGVLRDEPVTLLDAHMSLDNGLIRAPTPSVLHWPSSAARCSPVVGSRTGCGSSVDLARSGQVADG
jgi:hypothetical protein